MNSTTGLHPSLLHRVRSHSGRWGEGLQAPGAQLRAASSGKAQSLPPALSGVQGWDGHAQSHLWTSCTGS